MVVQHNLTAMNSNRMLGITTKTQAKSTEKLSSGYKINRAADDAAGLAISEKMRKQIRGLTQASLNAQDGISAVQTAEGALTEVHDMLQRMNELAVKSSNGPLSDTDRQNIQDEVDAIVKEIDRVSETTKFNETYLLRGSNTKNTNKAGFANAAVIGTMNGAKITANAATDITTGTKLNLGTVGLVSSNTTIIANNQGVNSAGTKTQGCINAAGTPDADKLSSVEITTEGAAAANITVKVTLKDGTELSMKGDEFQTKYGITFADTTNKGTVTFEKKLLGTTGVGADAAADIKVNDYAIGDTVNAEAFVAADGTVTFGVGGKSPLLFNLHVGADSKVTNKISLSIDSMDAGTLGVRSATGSLKVQSEGEATEAIDKIADAVAKVSRQRSALGAVQNRLEHTINNLDNVIENTTSAEAQIRDTDMATEMVKYSNNQILAQAGQAMLAQSNQANQGVLSLLQ